MTNPKVAVTGATGLVGGHLVQHLADNNYEVIAIGRSKEKLSHFQSPNIEIRIADIEDQEAVSRAISGADVVVHSAATVDPYGSRESIFATNVGGTKKILEAAKAQNVKHFLYVSSLSVITGQGDLYNVDESEPLKPCGESYADSKVEAERTVMAESENPQSKMKVTSLRPGFIYGPGERAWMPRLINSIATGKAMLIDGGKKETNVIYVENLSRAITSAILNEKAYGQVYNLTDGQKISKKELFDAIADGLGLPRVKKVVPGVAAKLFCEVVSSVAPMMGVDTQKKLARFSRAAFRLAGVNQGFSIAKAERELNYVDRVPFQTGISKTLVTFKTENGRK
ncbi:NAD-dependent epimerase/dehydratase family protein [Candidatus Obscuribacterales bacterium]|nr:NAD-dependent epimerase/dehydratase family protein [Candidatus Obscuribacterales bacterium]MBX3153948.1 NAD-dependent epimerase/dehydratase family protein [Candidatus Obscuribacterales bacterium]